MTDERIIAYLLHELSEAEAERFEEECFVQEEWPAELDSAEQDLIDAYLRNELGRDRRQRFEENYLTTDTRKARVLTAQSFHQVICPTPPQASPQTPTRRMTFWEKLQAFCQRRLVPQAAAAILVLAVATPVLIILMRGERAPQTFARVDLAASSSDRATGPQTTKITLPLGKDALQVHLKLPEQSPSAATYRVEWQDQNKSLGNRKIESQDAQFVVVNILASELSPGRYVLKLFREEQVIGNYYFTAEEAAATR